MVDGGWWEGIIEDRVGWFPGNHVAEVAPGVCSVFACALTKCVTKLHVLQFLFPEENNSKESKNLAINKRDSVLRYHDLVVQDILDSERTYVLEMMVSHITVDHYHQFSGYFVGLTN